MDSKLGKTLVLLNYVSRSLRSSFEGFIRHLPGPAGKFLRYTYYKKRFKHLGKNVVIAEGVYISDPRSVSIGDNTLIDINVILETGRPALDRKSVIFKKNESYTGESGELIIGKGCHIAPNVLIQSPGGVEIGDYVGVASGARIYSASHHYQKEGDESEVIYKFTPMAPPEEQCIIIGPVVMKNNTALGLNSVILPGVTVGANSWIGVCSFVIGDIPPNSIAVGCPAEVVRERRIFLNRKG